MVNKTQHKTPFSLTKLADGLGQRVSFMTIHPRNLVPPLLVKELSVN
jgi:hypothetical protein